MITWEASTESVFAQLRERGIPNHMMTGVRDYVVHGIEPGSFLYAVLSNDLVGAFGAADHINRAAMFQWASLLYNDIPSPAWRSRDAVNFWIAAGGLKGNTKENGQ